jgi:hypothetical protein
VNPSTIANVDVDGDGSTADDFARGWAFSLTTPLSPPNNTYDSQLPSARFYGGIYAAIAGRAAPVASAPSEGHINQNHELRDDWNFMALPSVSGHPEMESYEGAGLWLWKKEDFLNGGAQGSVSFAGPSDVISIFISRYFGGVHWGRWIVQNGAQFYASEPTFANLTEPLTETSPPGSTDGVIKTAHTIAPSAVRWAVYDPTRPAPRAMFFDWQENPDYQFRTFDDVQSVGFLVQRDLSVGTSAAASQISATIAVKWNAVEVFATVTPQADSSRHINLVPVGGTPEAPALWVAATEVTYADWIECFRWADSNQRARNFSDGIDRWIPPYTFDRDGAIGSAEVSLAASHSPFEPVTCITWLDAVAWCNALSELEGLEPVYRDENGDAGIYDVVVTSGSGYGAATSQAATVTVVEGLTNPADPAASISPGTPTIALLPESSSTVPLAIGNTGTGGLSWTLSWPGATPLTGTTGSMATSIVTVPVDSFGLSPGASRSIELALISNDPVNPAQSATIILDVVSAPQTPSIPTPAVLPAAVVGRAWSAAVVASGGAGAYTFALTSGDLPPGLGLAPDGLISGTPTGQGTWEFTVAATDSAASQAVKTFSVTVFAPPPPVILAGALPDGAFNVAYSAALSSASGLPPLTWSVASGALPEGFTLTLDGLLSGTTSGDGTYAVSMRVTDAYGATDEASYSLEILSPPPLAIAPIEIPDAALNDPYQVGFAAVDGYGGYHWSLADGALPPGVALDAGGQLSGTPTQAGVFPFTVMVTDFRHTARTKTLYLNVIAFPSGRPRVETGGWNLGAPSYWSQGNHFNDLVLSASRWGNDWSGDYPFATDAQGYPTAIPDGVMPTSKVTLEEPGDYVLTWIGEGELRLAPVIASAVTLISSDLSGAVKRRIYRKTTPVESPCLSRLIIDSLPVSGMHLWNPGQEPPEGATPSPFTASFLDRLRDDGAVLRFMNWGMVNESTESDWADRKRRDHFTQIAPASYELMIELCNTVQKDLWLCVPHLATEDYIRQLARLILTGQDGVVTVCEPLDPSLKIYVEWSNEAWNGIFPQFDDIVGLIETETGIQSDEPGFPWSQVYEFIGEQHALATTQSWAWKSKEASGFTGPTLLIERDPDQLVPTYLSHWRRIHFGTDGVDLSADPDGDGMKNLVEYVLDGDPNAVGPPPLGMPSFDAGTKSFTFQFNPAQRGRRVRVVGSTDLARWDHVLFDSDTDGIAFPGGWQRLTLDYSDCFDEGTDQFFIRIEAYETP